MFGDPVPENTRKILRQNRHHNEKPRATRAYRRPGITSPKSGAPKIELYQMENCPFSHAVRTRLSELGLDFIAHNVPERDSLRHKKLVEAGGKDQIPFLIDRNTGTKLYESEAILLYLDSRYGDKKARNRIEMLLRRAEVLAKNRMDQLAWMFRRPLDRVRSVKSGVEDSWAIFQEIYVQLKAQLRSQYRSLRKPSMKQADEL